MQPVNDWIWLDADLQDKEETSVGGIITSTETKTGGTVTGEVKAVGPGKYCITTGKRMPCGVDVGDNVVITKTIALQNKIVVSGNEYILVKDENILAKVGKKDVETS